MPIKNTPIEKKRSLYLDLCAERDNHEPHVFDDIELAYIIALVERDLGEQNAGI